MFLRFFQILLIYFLLFSYVESAESGGMPQLNPEFWFSQIFWLIISFGIMFILLSKFVLPKISENLEIRKAQILENIEVAEKQREESDKKLKEYEKLILKISLRSSTNFFLLIVHRDVAIVLVGSEIATPMVFVPRSNPRRGQFGFKDFIKISIFSAIKLFII